MFCENCGAAMNETDRFCLNCGQAVAQPEQHTDTVSPSAPLSLEQPTSKEDQQVYRPPIPPVLATPADTAAAPFTDLHNKPEPDQAQSLTQNYSPPPTQTRNFASPGGGSSHPRSGGENPFTDFSNEMNTGRIQRRTGLSGMLLWAVVGLVIVGIIVITALLK